MLKVMFIPRVKAHHLGMPVFMLGVNSHLCVLKKLKGTFIDLGVKGFKGRENDFRAAHPLI